MTADASDRYGKAKPLSTYAGAAIAALALAGALGLALFLSFSMSAKTSSWRAALPTAAMTATEAETALLQAELLHEEAMRPRLILAGFGTEADLDGQERWRSYRTGESSSLQLTTALWSLRAFPELHETLLGVLLDTKQPPGMRTTRFYTMAGTLEALAAGLANPSERRRSYSYHSSRDENALWFSYYNHAPDLKLQRSNDGYSPGQRSNRRQKDQPPTKDQAPTAKERTLFTEKMALAQKIFPLILTDMVRHADEKAAKDKKEAELAAQNGTIRRRSDRPEAVWENEDAYGRAAEDAIHTLWDKRADPSFFPLAREAMAAQEGSPAERYAAVSLMAKRPGLPVSEYLFWGKYKNDLAGVTSCLGPNPTSFAYLIGCCDKLSEIAKTTMKEQGALILAGHEGPGITLTESGGMSPAPDEGGKLYLLADMPSALRDAPAYDMKRALPVFTGLLFRYMESQPVVLPLDPANNGDAALIEWYKTQGWTKGHTMLFSAAGAPSAVARHWGSLHLLWWSRDKKDKNKEEGPDLALLHPESGAFMLGTLPALKGQAAARFMGPITALWFGVADVDKSGWRNRMYTARPDKALLPPAFKASGKQPAILVSEPIAADLGNQHYRRYKIELAQWLAKKYPDPAVEPIAFFTFVSSTAEQLNGWKIVSSRDMTRGADLLWRFRNDPEAERILRSVLSQEKIAAYIRLEEARRALGLSKEDEL